MPAPNIILSMSTYMGYGTVGRCKRQPKIPTPNMDRQAEESMHFTDPYPPPPPVVRSTAAGTLHALHALHSRTRCPSTTMHPSISPNVLPPPQRSKLSSDLDASRTGIASSKPLAREYGDLRSVSGDQPQARAISTACPTGLARLSVYGIYAPESSRNRLKSWRALVRLSITL